MNQETMISARGMNFATATIGDGNIPIFFIHGNLACKEWLLPSAPALSRELKVYAADWRGCGGSDKPQPDEDYGNYSIAEHAQDMLALLDELGLEHCHLATHSTGGIIAGRMQMLAPERFGAVFHLDPIAPGGMAFTDEAADGMAALRESPALSRYAMATAVSSLFFPESIDPAKMPTMIVEAGARAAVFEMLLEAARSCSPGIWGGTLRAINKEFELGEIRASYDKLNHETLILWGELDPIIPREHVTEMARDLPNARLVTLPGIGHSANVERPDVFAGAFNAFFGGRQL